MNEVEFKGMAELPTIRFAPTFKAGDRVRIKTRGLKTQPGESGVPVFVHVPPGTEFEVLSVADWILGDHVAGVVVRGRHPTIGDANIWLDDLELVLELVVPAPPSCTCDTMLLMRAGCQCGALDR